MLLFNILMSIQLLMISYFSFKNDTVGILFSVILFIVFFQFSTGCVTWLYLAEILHDKAMSIATHIVWFMSLAVSVSIPLILQSYEVGSIFLFFGVCTILGSLFIALFMEETMGKTQKEIDELYCPSNDKDE